MAEEKQVETTIETPATDKVEQTTETPAEKVEISKVEFEKLQAALKEANREAAARRKRLDELEAAEAARKEAEMTEVEKAQKRSQELEAELHALRHAEAQRAAAEKVGLPLALAARLIGDNADDLEADAKTLLETLPKQQVKPTSTLKATNPGAEGSSGETDDQFKARVFGKPGGIFDPAIMKDKGGGVFFKE